ncbi:hypothetical protein TNCV_4247461 [Trichonephila clavipes]|nr:hypothetical protein TNCV_4247461 [Trichonephila clavipes]
MDMSVKESGIPSGILSVRRYDLQQRLQTTTFMQDGATSYIGRCQSTA